MTDSTMEHSAPEREFTAAEIGAIAHLYRAEVGRSTSWRTRLDNTTNWAVVTTGIALSLSYNDHDASALPLVLVMIIVGIFLGLEARPAEQGAQRPHCTPVHIKALADHLTEQLRQRALEIQITLPALAAERPL